jgi:hypothetical protein
MFASSQISKSFVVFGKVQSLWHIPQFRNELACKTAPGHKHVGDPCVVCGLAEIFDKLSAAIINPSREIVYPTSLSIAIDKLSPCGDLFQKVCIETVVYVLHFSAFCFC